MAEFHTLKVTGLRRETRDAVVVTLEPRPEARRLFAFTPGQYLTFRRALDGQELRRAYSICAGCDEGCLKVAIKRVEGGAFSGWANEALAHGDEIEAMPPMGAFFAPGQGAAPRYLGVAAGSGITPVLSILKTVLSRAPDASFTLLYANRATSTIMFRDEIEDLKNIYLGRLSVLHVLEAEAREIELLSGRLDAEKLRALFRVWIDPRSIDMALICGPEPMMRCAASALREHGLRDDQIRYELFAPARGAAARPPVRARAPAGVTEARVTLDGVTRSLRVARDGRTLLDAALAEGIELPFACKAGVCAACRCRVLRGEVEMALNHAIEDDEVRAGYVLGCQAVPLSDELEVSFDE